MGRHEENTTVRGIVNMGGTNTFKNTVVNGQQVDDKSLSTPKPDDKKNRNKKR